MMIDHKASADDMFRECLLALEQDNGGPFRPDTRKAIENAFRGGMLCALRDLSFTMKASESVKVMLARRWAEVLDYQERLDATPQ